MPNFTDYIASEACIPWPDAAGHVMAAFAYDAGNAGDYGKDLIVVLVNTKKKEVVASYKGQIQEDGAMRVEADTLSFDQGSYGLVAPGIRLFALDKKSGYIFHCGDGGSGSDRTFFVVDGKVIRVVLDQFMTSSWYYTKGGLARCGASDEEVETEDTYYSITIDKEKTNGFADLLFTAQPSSSMEPFHCKLRYDGKQYLLPDIDKDCKQKYNEWDALYRAKVPMRH